MATEIISLEESRRLIALEGVIETGKRTFVEVGLALAEIRDSKLYRVGHATFEAYCRAKWGFAKSYAYDLIKGATTVAALPANLSAIADTEGKAREVAKVAPDRREDVVQRAASKAEAEGRAVTARDISEADDEPPRVVTRDVEEAEPVKPENRAFRLSLAIQRVKTFVRDELAGLNPTSGDMIKMAIALKDEARRIERAVEANEA